MFEVPFIIEALLPHILPQPTSTETMLRKISAAAAYSDLINLEKDAGTCLLQISRVVPSLLTTPS